MPIRCPQYHLHPQGSSTRSRYLDLAPCQSYLAQAWKDNRLPLTYSWCACRSPRGQPQHAHCYRNYQRSTLYSPHALQRWLVRKMIWIAKGRPGSARPGKTLFRIGGERCFRGALFRIGGERCFGGRYFGSEERGVFGGRCSGGRCFAGRYFGPEERGVFGRRYFASGENNSN